MSRSSQSPPSCSAAAASPSSRTRGRRPRWTRPRPPRAPRAARGGGRADLRVKRWRQLSLDLQGALELPEDQVCKEAGNFDCAVLHTAQLGGVSVDHALYEPITWWTVTTGLAMERFSLQACHNRLVLDRDGDAPVVYTHVELGATTLTAEAADAQATELWRRVLARDPAAWELEAARDLHADVVADGANNGEWAALLCFSLATSTEHLLY